MFQASMLHRLLQGNIPISKTIHLQTGQLFQGYIKQLYPGSLAQLQLGGLTVTAKLEAQLEKGQKYWFQVLGGDGLPKLKVMDGIPIINLKQASGEQNTKAILQRFGIPYSNEAVRLISNIIRDNIPFTQGTLRETIGLLNLNGTADTDTDIQVILQLLHKNLPLTREAFLSIRSLYTDYSLAAVMKELAIGLRQTGEYPTLEQRLSSLLEQPLIETVRDEINQHPLQMLIRQLGLQMEFDIHDQLGKNHIQSSNSLKALLLQYMQMETTNSTNRDIAELILQRLTSFQLLSCDTKGPMQQMVVQVPISLGNTYQDLTIQWEGRRKENGSIDENHCRIIFYIELESLKETIIDVQIQKRIVTIQIYNEIKKPSNSIEYFLPLLRKNLEALNFHFSSLKWIQPEKIKTKALKQQPYSDITYGGVDIRI